MSEEPHIDTVEARGGATPHVGRYVLVISMILIVVVFAILLFIWR